MSPRCGSSRLSRHRITNRCALYSNGYYMLDGGVETITEIEKDVKQLLRETTLKYMCILYLELLFSPMEGLYYE